MTIATDPLTPGASATAHRPASPAALLIVLAGTFITVLDFFIVNVAIPSVQADLDATPAQIQLTIAGYGLAFAAMLITAGRLGDLYGRRRMFVIGLLLFTVASAISGLAGTAEELIAARIAQGLGAALLTPQVLAIIGVAYTGARRARAFGAYGMTIGLAGVFGQLIGGALIAANIDGSGWRAIFLINVPIGLVALALAPRMIPETRGEGGRSRLDLPGALLVTAGLAAIVLPLVEGREQGWPEWSWLCLAAAVPLLGAFLGHQRAVGRRGGAPLLDLGLFRERAFSIGVLMVLVYYCAMGSFFLILALFLQQGRGLSALDAGLLALPMGVGFFVAGGAAPKLAARLGRQVLATGAVAVAVGYGVLAGTVSWIGGEGSVLALIPGLAISGFGMGLVMAPLSNVVLAGVAPRHAASGSGVLSTAQEIGGALGVALVGIVFYGSVGADGASGYARAFDLSMILLAGVALVVAGLAQLLPKPPRA